MRYHELHKYCCNHKPILLCSIMKSSDGTHQLLKLSMLVFMISLFVMRYMTSATNEASTDNLSRVSSIFKLHVVIPF